MLRMGCATLCDRYVMLLLTCNSSGVCVTVIGIVHSGQEPSFLPYSSINRCHVIKLSFLEVVGKVRTGLRLYPRPADRAPAERQPLNCPPSRQSVICRPEPNCALRRTAVCFWTCSRFYGSPPSLACSGRRCRRLNDEIGDAFRRIEPKMSVDACGTSETTGAPANVASH